MSKPASKTSQLDTLAKKILDQKICPELAHGASQLVFSDGRADAEVVLVGEAPGRDEDLQGKPFVGAAGKFLNAMIQSLGWKRSDVYITNIVKYRPPNNRDPLPEEVEAFMPYLLAQIAIIKPKLIVTLGRYAMNVFLPSQRISQIHGQPKRIKIKANKVGLDSLVILPLYHPAAALYNGGMRDVLQADFARIPKILSKV